MSEVRALVRLVYWDWVREVRRFETLLSMVLFALITLMIFAFAIDPTSETGVRVRSGVLWITFLLSGAIGIDRAFRGEGEDRLLQGILLAPLSRITLYYGKIASTFLFVVLMEAITLVVFLLLYNVPMTALGLARLAAVAAGGTIGYVAVGVTLSAMTRAIRGGDVLLRLLLFPLMIPVFAAVVDATKHAFQGEAISSEQILLVVAFDVIYLAAGQILFDVILADYDAG